MKGHCYSNDSTAATAAESTTLRGRNGVNTLMTNHTPSAMRTRCGGIGLINVNAISAPNVSGDNLGAMITIWTMSRLTSITPLEASTNNGSIRDLLSLTKQKCKTCFTAWHGLGISKAHLQITNGQNW